MTNLRSRQGFCAVIGDLFFRRLPKPSHAIELCDIELKAVTRTVSVAAPQASPNPYPFMEVDFANAFCDGDVRSALKAALVANAFLMAEVERLQGSTSLGYRRGKMPSRRKASIRLDDWRDISDNETISDNLDSDA